MEAQEITEIDWKNKEDPHSPTQRKGRIDLLPWNVKGLKSTIKQSPEDIMSDPNRNPLNRTHKYTRVLFHAKQNLNGRPYGGVSCLYKTIGEIIMEHKGENRIHITTNNNSNQQVRRQEIHNPSRRPEL